MNTLRETDVQVFQPFVCIHNEPSVLCSRASEKSTTRKENSRNCSWSLFETVPKSRLTSHTNVLLDRVRPVFLSVNKGGSFPALWLLTGLEPLPPPWLTLPRAGVRVQGRVHCFRPPEAAALRPQSDVN